MAKNMLHPGARWVFRIRGWFGAIFLSIFLGWILWVPLAFILKGFNLADVSTILGVALGGMLFYLIFIIVVGEIYARMAYNRWFYEFTNSELKLERGIIWKRYSNVPYERVQNVDINRGIIARLAGFSTVDIQTAGFHYAGRGGGGFSEGHIPAVDMHDAEKIREFLMKKISKRHGQGL